MHDLCDDFDQRPVGDLTIWSSVDLQGVGKVDPATDFSVSALTSFASSAPANPGTSANVVAQLAKVFLGSAKQVSCDFDVRIEGPEHSSSLWRIEIYSSTPGISSEVLGFGLGDDSVSAFDDYVNFPDGGAASKHQGIVPLPSHVWIHVRMIVSLTAGSAALLLNGASASSINLRAREAVSVKVLFGLSYSPNGPVQAMRDLYDNVACDVTR